MPKPVNIPIQFVVHPLPGSAEQLGDKLKEVGDRLRNGNFGLPAIPSVTSAGAGAGPSPAGGFFGGSNVHVTHIEVGPSHFAFLLEDGRVCRLPFSVISDRLDLNRNSGAASGKLQTSGSARNPPTGSHGFFVAGAGKSSGKAHVSAAAGESSSPNLNLMNVHGLTSRFPFSVTGVRQAQRRGHRIIRSTALRGRAALGNLISGTRAGKEGTGITLSLGTFPDDVFVVAF
jgi:hypothetical protein